VITDCRFENEINAIKQAGGLIVRIARGDPPEWAVQVKNWMQAGGEWMEKCLAYTIERGVHVSEWASLGMDEDILLENNTTLQDLYQQINTKLGQYCVL
jgi:hypothetical protein